MTSRRGNSHVRPRPQSSGRTTQPVKVAAPDRRRVRQHRGLDARRKRAPLATRTLLALAVAVIGGVAFVTASGGIGPVLATLGNGFTNAFDRLTATPLPSSTQLPPTDSPRIASPEEPFTNEANISLSVSVPLEVIGDPTAKVRIYLALEGLEPAPIVDVPVGTTSRMSVAFELVKGKNNISATLFRGEEESEHSPIVTWILDTDPPKITVTKPKNNAAIDAREITIEGTTQANTSLVALNAANDTSISSLSAKDGSFEFGMLLEPGTNVITITGTDPAGNVGEGTLTLLQGSTDIVVRLTASSYRISISNPPPSIQLSVLVLDPLGVPLAGAEAFFTLQLPGLAPISNALVTGLDGRAIFTTPLIGELTTGGGLGTVLVSSELYGASSDRVTLTFVK
jgi:Glucodextranase, domain B